MKKEQMAWAKYQAAYTKYSTMVHNLFGLKKDRQRKRISPRQSMEITRLMRNLRGQIKTALAHAQKAHDDWFVAFGESSR